MNNDSIYILIDKDFNTIEETDDYLWAISVAKDTGMTLLVLPITNLKGRG